MLEKFVKFLGDIVFDGYYDVVGVDVMFKNLVSTFYETGDSAIAFSLYDGEKITEITYGRFAKDILKTAGYFAENRCVL